MKNIATNEKRSNEESGEKEQESGEEKEHVVREVRYCAKCGAVVHNYERYCSFCAICPFA